MTTAIQPIEARPTALDLSHRGADLGDVLAAAEAQAGYGPRDQLGSHDYNGAGPAFGYDDRDIDPEDFEEATWK